MLLFLIVIFISFSNICCKKLVEVEAPYTNVNSDNLYANDATAIGALTGIYAKMSSTSIFNGGLTSMSFFPGLSADEYTLYSGVTDINLLSYYKNSLSSSITSTSSFWSRIFPVIYTANSAIEGLNSSKTLTSRVKQQLLGEAEFIRAFCYFYLINLYGDVPLILSTDYTINTNAYRSEKKMVWKQIIADLKSAKDLLATEFPDNTLLGFGNERVRPTQWAASALLARCYLYTSDYTSADSESTSIIDHKSLFNIIIDINEVFLRNSSEAIWQLQPVNAGWNTEDGRWFKISANGPSTSRPIYLSTNILNAFEMGDLRESNWINTITVASDTFHYPYKYKSAILGSEVTEYSMILRLAEQYLIRAEARAQMGNITGNDGALADLNIIRNRAGLEDYSGPTDQTSILATILHENQVEFFSEWGHRWLDLKRTGNVNAIMSTVALKKGGSWNTNWQLYPIPLVELQKSINVKQNPGYE
jgi:hypothetical protein